MRVRKKVDRRRRQQVRFKLTRDYGELSVRLRSASTLESDAAADILVLTVIELVKHLDELRIRADKGKISTDERRVIPAIASNIKRALDALGCGRMREVGLEDL